jgi:hypothetical protein
MPANLAAHLQSVLKDNGLYASILAMDSKEMAELSIALSDALNVAKYAIYTRCHPEEAKS